MARTSSLSRGPNEAEEAEVMLGLAPGRYDEAFFARWPAANARRRK